MAPPANLVRLVDAQARTRERVRETLGETIARLIREWSGFYDADDRLTTELLRLVQPAQVRTAALTDAYLARVLGELLGRAREPVGVRVDPEKLRGDVTRRTVYDRVAADYRRHRARGDDDATAREKTARRARVIADDDLALASREASRQVFTRTPGITGYRRVIRPELATGGTCGLCVAASDRVYRTGELMPIHARCNCETLPIVGQRDPGKTLNADELDALYARAGGTDAAKLKRARYTVHEHGELGPVLREPGDEFRSPADVADDVAA